MIPFQPGARVSRPKLEPRTDKCDHASATGNELLRKLRRLARRKGVVIAFDPRPRRGGHGEIRFGDAITTLRSSRPKEIPSGTLRAMLSQIGVDPREL
jgi:mRNA interferase HicA